MTITPIAKQLQKQLKEMETFCSLECKLVVDHFSTKFKHIMIANKSTEIEKLSRLFAKSKPVRQETLLLSSSLCSEMLKHRQQIAQRSNVIAAADTYNASISRVRRSVTALLRAISFRDAVVRRLNQHQQTSSSSSLPTISTPPTPSTPTPTTTSTPTITPSANPASPRVSQRNQPTNDTSSSTATTPDLSSSLSPTVNIITRFKNVLVF